MAEGGPHEALTTLAWAFTSACCFFILVAEFEVVTRIPFLLFLSLLGVRISFKASCSFKDILLLTALSVMNCIVTFVLKIFWILVM